MKSILITLLICLLSLGAFAQDGKGLSLKDRNAIEAIMAPLRIKVETQLKSKDPKLFAGYQSDLKKAMALPDVKQQKAALTALEGKYYAFVKAGYDAAKVDEAGAKTKISALLKASGYSFKFSPFLGIIGTFTGTVTPETPTNPCVEFNCPFEVRNTTMSLNLNTGGSGFTSNYCTARTGTAAVVAGGREDFTALGEFATIHANMARVDVTSSFDYILSGFAGACIGGSYANASVGFVVKGPGVDKRFEHVSDWALAPVIWYNAFEKSGTNDRLQGSFVPSSQGGEYKVQLFAKSFAVAGVLALSYGSAYLEAIDYLKVCEVKK
jgi:hypothetical protein